MLEILVIIWFSVAWLLIGLKIGDRQGYKRGCEEGQRITSQLDIKEWSCGNDPGNIVTFKMENGKDTTIIGSDGITRTGAQLEGMGYHWDGIRWVHGGLKKEDEL
jgi:hypothetical protein